jgi:hypothetical protein
MNDRARPFRVYQRLLCLYPRAFRAEYSELMLQIFRDLCRETSRRRGRMGVAFLWGRVLPDLFVSSVQQHLNHWSVMKSVLLASVGALVGGLLIGASTFVVHSSAGAFLPLAYLCIALFCLYAALGFFRQIPWLMELVAGLVIFVAMGLFLPWWAKVSQELGLRVPVGHR